MMPCARLLLTAAFVVAAGGAPAARQAASLPAAVPVDAVTGILDAFRLHSIVMLAHPHGNEQKARFNLALIRDPRFAGLVNDIVDEGSNSRYQAVMDRFVHGEEVPYADLRRVWEDGIQIDTTCCLPMYEELYRTVREINRTLPPARQVRVLLGEPPIDWDQVRSYADIAAWEEQRDTHAASLIRREVLAKGRRALVLYGEMHAQRRTERMNYGTASDLCGILEADGKTRVFNIWPQIGSGKPDLLALQNDAARWPVPGIARLRGTSLGAMEFTSFFTSDGRFQVVDGKPQRIDREQWKPMRMEDQFDAVLYLGPSSSATYQAAPASLCRDQSFMETRFRRMALVPQMRGRIEQLKQQCLGKQD
jgi:hypothetical protein